MYCQLHYNKKKKKILPYLNAFILNFINMQSLRLMLGHYMILIWLYWLVHMLFILQLFLNCD